MGYGKLKPSDPGGSPFNQYKASPSYPPPRSRRKKLLFFSSLYVILLIAAVVSAVFLVGLQTKTSGRPDINLPHKPTLQHFSRALYLSTGISNFPMNSLVRSAYEDCLELLEDSIDAMARSLFSVSSLPGEDTQTVGSPHDILTWLSAALTNQDTCMCMEGFEAVSGTVKSQMTEGLRDLSELVSNCLAIFSGTDSSDFSGLPIQNRRRLMEAADTLDEKEKQSEDFSRWMSREERELLSLPASAGVPQRERKGWFRNFEKI